MSARTIFLGQRNFSAISAISARPGPEAEAVCPDCFGCGNRVTSEGLEDDEVEILAMIRTFERTGGILSQDEFAARSAAAHGCQKLAYELISSRKVVAFSWRGSRFFPGFQFKMPEMLVLDGVSAVLAEFTSVMDDDALCKWFGRSNSWVGGVTPAEMVGCAPAMILEAARVDRFIFRG